MVQQNGAGKVNSSKSKPSLKRKQRTEEKPKSKSKQPISKHKLEDDDDDIAEDDDWQSLSIPTSAEYALQLSDNSEDDEEAHQASASSTAQISDESEEDADYEYSEDESDSVNQDDFGKLELDGNDEEDEEDDVYVSDDDGVDASNGNEEENIPEVFKRKSKEVKGKQDDDENDDELDVLESYQTAFDKSEETKPKAPSIFDDVDKDDDSSEDESMVNTIGNVPLEWYEEYEHIGYDINGQKIFRKKQRDALDNLLAQHDDPKYLRTVYDEVNDKETVFSKEDLENIMRIAQGKFPAGVNPYREYVDYVKVDDRFPLTENTEAKAKFIPNKDEERIINQIAYRMQQGWIKPTHVLEKEKEERRKKEQNMYLIWSDDGKRILDPEMEKKLAKHRIIAAPKLSLPGHADSYNPSPEYVDPDKPVYSSMRAIPQYKNYIREVFDRCLDLYLAPRTEITKKRVLNPEALLPDLPKPEELRPFPEIQTLVYFGHKDIVRTISVDPNGRWLVSGSNDHTVRMWEISTGRCMRIWTFKAEIKHVEWNPNPKLNLIAVAVENFVYLLQPPESGTEETNQFTSELFPAKGYKEDEDVIIEQLFAEDASTLAEEKTGEDDKDVQDEHRVTSATKKGREVVLLKWTFYRKEDDKQFRKQGIVACLTHLRPVSQVNWHHKGDYFCSLSPDAYSDGIVIHQISKRQSQKPFKKKLKNNQKVSKIGFHPKLPLFYVISQTRIFCYNLIQQKLFKRFKNNKCKYISSFDVHPGGYHLLVGGYDKRVEWFDMELSSKPFKTFRYHNMAVRSVAYHKRYPLFASCSDDANIHIFHNTVYDGDWLKDPMIVPLKILQGYHQRSEHLGIMDIKFHPIQPWLFSCGADKTIRLFTS